MRIIILLGIRLKQQLSYRGTDRHYTFKFESFKDAVLENYDYVVYYGIMDNIKILLHRSTPVIYEILDLKRFKSFIFIQKLFLYFWFGSLVGQLYEIVAWNHNSDTLIPFAPPYGFGMIAVIIFISPLLKKQIISSYKAFFLITLTMGLVEYLCAVVIILVNGENNYWNYSDRVLNFGGNVCAESAILFGLMATIFLYYIYPFTEKIFAKQQRKITDILFGATFFFFVFDMFYSVIL